MKDFDRFDRNRDGLITAQEAHAVAARESK